MGGEGGGGSKNIMGESRRSDVNMYVASFTAGQGGSVKSRGVKFTFYKMWQLLQLGFIHSYT